MNQESLPATQNGIPLSTRPFFQEYLLEILEVEADRRLVIERLLAYGNRQEVAWLFHQYGENSIRQWLAESRGCSLPYRRYSLWCFLCGLQPEERGATRKGVWQY